jgi:hypothetical protein
VEKLQKKKRRINFMGGFFVLIPNLYEAALFLIPPTPLIKGGKGGSIKCIVRSKWYYLELRRLFELLCRGK